MKRTILLIAIGAIFIAATTERKYSLQFTTQELGELYECLDKSEASHVKVESLKSTIIKQYQAQTDTTKNKP